MSVPSASAANPAATAAALPPTDPPGTRVVSCGLRVGPNAEFSVRRAHGELVEVGLADDDGAGGAQPLDDGGVVRRPPALEDLRRARRRDAPRAQVVLQRDGHAGERAGVVARGDPRVDRRGGGPGLVGEDEVEGVELGLARVDAAEVLARRTSAAVVRRRRATAAAISMRAPSVAPARGSAARGSGRPRPRARRRAPRRGRGTGRTTSARSTLTSGYGWVIGATSSRSRASMSAKWSSIPASWPVNRSSSSAVRSSRASRATLATSAAEMRSDTAPHARRITAAPARAHPCAQRRRARSSRSGRSGVPGLGVLRTGPKFGGRFCEEALRRLR